MKWKNWVRQSHRWLSIVFTVSVLVAGVAVATGQTAEWLYMLPLVPLALLTPSGLYMFVLPYVDKSRRARSSSEAQA